MASDYDLSMFRRFIALNTRNLLYLQSEITSLQLKLQELDTGADDVKKGNATWSIPRSLYCLQQENGNHMATVLRIRELLEKYNKALQGQAWLLSQKKPESRPSTNLSSYLKEHRTEMSQSDAEFMSERYCSDCAALSTAEKEPLFMFLERHLFWLFKSKEDRERADDGPMGFYSERRIRAFVRLLAILVSSILPIMSIVALYYIPSQNTRLGAIVAFSSLCSAALSLLTDAKNVEIIAATAAYAAVQAVFVSGSVTAEV